MSSTTTKAIQKEVSYLLRQRDTKQAVEQEILYCMRKVETPDVRNQQTAEKNSALDKRNPESSFNKWR